MCAQRITRPSVEERFWAKVDKTDGCWLWTGTRPRGYGSFYGAEKRQVRAHRFAYEQLVGPIPEGLVLDHLCRNPSCVNPDHLEAVTERVNILRGVGPTAIQARKTHCKHGHEFTPENTYVRPHGGRDCRVCKNRCERERGRRMRERKGAA